MKPRHPDHRLRLRYERQEFEIEPRPALPKSATGQERRVTRDPYNASAFPFGLLDRLVITYV